ncbi:MAG: hypothetical protein WKF34_03645 [Pyrinomonadaceae bacterium]
MSQNFQPGDFLVFQLEAGFALLRLLSIDDQAESKVWHVAAYREFFPDVETAESATTASPTTLTISERHLALTDRAFLSTQVARIGNAPLSLDDLAAVDAWRNDSEREASDRSVRLMLGFR